MSDVIQISRRSPDPRAALNTFTWNMAAAREMGFTPTTELVLIEQLARKEVTVGYYTSMGGGVLAIVTSDTPELFDDADFETAAFALTRLQRRFKRRSQHREMTAGDIELATPKEDNPDGN